MRVRRILSALSPVIVILGCDLLPQAYDTGYGCGYQFVDGYFACSRACAEQRREREAEILEWEEACQGSTQDHFSTQPPIDDADRRCADQYGYGNRLVVCADVGQEPGTHPPNCHPFRDPTFATVAGNYSCPAETSGRESSLCLCCGDVSRPSCELSGGFCRDDDDCCGGRCVLDEPEPPATDGGFVPSPRGTCR